MTAHTTSAADTIREMYEAAINGDLEKFFGYIADDFVLEEPPYLAYGGTYSGREGFAELVTAATAVIDLSSLAIDYVFGDEERACARITCAVVGTKVRTPIVEEWIVRDGSVRWGRVFWFDPGVIPAPQPSQG
jgi:ketosteroid isomerase-like protein